MQRLSRRWRIMVAAVLLLPWMARAPRLLQKRVESLALESTWELPQEKRKRFFLKRDLPGNLDEDYFRIMDAAGELLGRKERRFFVRVPEETSHLRKSLLAWGYITFELCPARPALDPSNADVLLFYRTEPDTDHSARAQAVKGAPGSFIAETR